MKIWAAAAFVAANFAAARICGLDEMDAPVDWSRVEVAPAFSLQGTVAEAKVARVVDGDSLDLIMPFGGKLWTWKCRLAGIDAPETRTRDLAEKQLGLQAKEWVESLVANRVVEAACGQFDKYGRLLVRVRADGRDLGDALVAEGLAREYDGGK